jgi:hypothetical protein
MNNKAPESKRSRCAKRIDRHRDGLLFISGWPSSALAFAFYLVIRRGPYSRLPVGTREQST